MKKMFCFVWLILAWSQAQATSIDWSGVFRLEFNQIHNTSMDSAIGGSKEYFLNHLSLTPKLIVSDGINVTSRFEILPNQTYKNSLLGQPFGSGVNRNLTVHTAPDSNSISTQQRTYALEVSQLYLTLNQEHGALIAGRAPLKFGMGITYSGGEGMFDHWQDSQDVIGYKFMIGNMFFMPMLGKQYDPSISRGSDVNDMIWHIEYENEETESAIGVFHRTRSAKCESEAPNTCSLNDVDAQALAGAGAFKSQDWNTQHVNIYFARGFEKVKFRFEAGFESGNTGVKTATGEEVKLSGYGVASEVEFPYGASKWSQLLRFGLVSGDDPSTANYEGYWFDRNYDVAFLMFNHPLGQVDVYRSRLQRNTDLNGSLYATDQAVDEEAISNAVYFAPRFNYRMSDKWEWTNTLAWAQWVAKPVAGAQLSKDIGLEYDLGFNFRPTNRVQWSNVVGVFMPGGAWEGGAGFKKDLIYGFNSTLAVSF
jgi:hypothetical protein